MTEMESTLFRMLEMRGIQLWEAEPYFYSYQYIEDSAKVRTWMRDNGIQQRFMLYGDQMSGGLVCVSGPYWKDGKLVNP